MTDYGTILRKAYFSLIDGNLTALGGSVPMFDEKLEPAEGVDIYVKIGSTDEESRDNKHHFAALCGVHIDIVQKTLSVGSKVVVDEVSNQILGLLFTDPRTTNLVLDAPLKLTYARLDATKTEPLKAIPQGFMIVKRLTFLNRVYQ
jgi:hypothetical protein